jgi:hypothetical protein
MSLRSKHLKIVGAVGAAALTVGSLASPALAAGELSAEATYSCFNDAIQPDTTFTVDMPSTTSLVAGQKVKSAASANVVLGPLATNFLRSQGWDHFKGNVKAKSPSKTLGMDMSVPSTPVGPASGQTNVSASGVVVLDYPAAGTYTLKAGNFTANLRGFDASNDPLGPPTPVACVSPNDGSTVLKDSGDQSVTITVKKDKSKTQTTAGFAAKKHKATGKAKVKGAKYGLPGTGKVKFILKKGTKTVASKKGKLNKKGVAKVVFKNVKAKGKYSIVAKFGGDKGLKKSSGNDTFKV